MKHLLLLLLLTSCCASFAQLPYQNISYADALKRSAAENKLILIQYESATCTQCNEVADKGLNDAKVVAQLAPAFICLKVDVQHPDRSLIGAQYNIEKSFGTLFIDRNGTLIHKFPGSTTFAAKYAEQADMALQKAGEGVKLSELEKEYKAGNKSPGILEALLIKKRSLNLPTDDLLDEYATSLPADSSKAIRTLQFIASMAPILGSKADQVLRADRNAFNTAWYAMDLPKRANFNSAIIFKSMAKAVAEKNIAFAIRTASFTRGTYDTNPAAGEKAFDANMLHYYEAINDTVNYFPRAIAYYEKYFMHLSADSISKIDSQKSMAQLNSKPGDTVRMGDKVVIKKSVISNPVAQNFTNTLSNAALTFYQKTDNPYYLAIALEWVTKSLTFFETPEALNIDALLLYKLGQKGKAIATEEKVIAIRKQRGFPIEDNSILLERMKKDLPIN